MWDSALGPLGQNAHRPPTASSININYATINNKKRVNKHGEMAYTAAVMRSDRVKGKVVQTTVAYLGRVEEDQIPYLKAAYAKKKPRLVWDDEESPQQVGLKSSRRSAPRGYNRTRREPAEKGGQRTVTLKVTSFEAAA